MSIIDISRKHPGIIFRTLKRTYFPSSISASFNSLHIFPNQIKFGEDIYHKFLDRSVHSILALALTQSGKTGAMLAVIRAFLNSPKMPLPIQHVFIITGHSSTEWLQQTRERFPLSIANNIFHRNTLHTFSKRISGLTNVLILIDETQVACLQSQSIQSSLVKAGITQDKLFSMDIKFVLVSATPNSCIKRFIPLKPGHEIVYMDPAPGYTSIFKLHEKGLVFQCNDLCGFDKKTGQFLPFALDNIKEIQIGHKPKYHIIRTHHSFMHTKTIDNFRTVFGSSCRFLSMPDLDSLLIIPPDKHTFIFIKETLRCAKTIFKDYLGVLYDRYANNLNDSSVIQGLAGRATGYHSINITVFTNIPSIVKYHSLWKHSFNPDLLWNSDKKNPWTI